ncbi:MAG: hypothetical protein QNJ42_05480 [Crocosphaera sp.]|nr:hypothetical protein [Crocosphaera sp.]
MIWESCYWKDPLLELVKEIDKWEMNKNLDEPELAEIERQIMIGFYSIRKLIEAKKLSNQVINKNWICISYPNLKNVHRFNWDDFDTLYNLESPKHENRKLLFICHQIIHSYVFIIDEKDSGFSGIFFVSDRLRNKILFHISSKELKRIFDVVGNDDPSSGTRTFNPETKDYEVNNDNRSWLTEEVRSPIL